MNAPRVLIVRFSAIGDCIMTAWPVTAIRKKWPDAHIGWAVQDSVSQVVDTSTLVDSRHELPYGRWKGAQWSPATWREQIRRYALMSSERYDFGLDFQGHLKTALCLRLARPRKRMASRATDAFTRILNPVVGVGDEPMHEVERGYRLIQHLGEFEPVDRPITPSFDDGDAQIAKELDGSRVLVTVQTGAGNERKTYPAAMWAEAVDRIARPDRQIVAIGGPGDPKIDHPAVVNKVGVWSLETSLAAVRASALHLAGDTGTGHAAAAFGTPVVSVFSYEDPAVFRPWTEKGTVLKNTDDPKSVSPKEISDAALSHLEGIACGS